MLIIHNTVQKRSDFYCTVTVFVIHNEWLLVTEDFSCLLWWSWLVIAGKTQEMDYQLTAKKVSKLVADYNQILIDQMSGKAARRN